MLRYMNSSDPYRLLHTNGNFTIWAEAIEQHDAQWRKEPVLNYLFCISMLGLSFFGTAANIMVLTSFFVVKELHQVQYMFVGNLCLADLVVTGFIIPLNVYGTIAGPALFRDVYWLCEFVGTICCSVCSGSVWCICAISVERYVCICHYHLYTRLFTFKTAILFILCLWFIAHMIHLPNFVGWGHTGYSRDLYLCTAEVELFSYSIFYGITAVLTPIIISFWAYLRVYLRVRTSNAGRKMIVAGKNSGKTEKKTAVEGATQVKLSEKEVNAKKQAIREEMQLLKALFKVFIIFLISWLPLAIFFIIRAVVGFPKWYSYMGLLLAHGSSATNSVVYFYMTDLVTLTRNAYRKMWRRYQGKTGAYPDQTRGTMSMVSHVSATKRSQSKSDDNSQVELIKAR